MMTLENIRPFGRHVPGDRVIVPDGLFDSYYWVLVPDDADKKTEDE